MTRDRFTPLCTWIALPPRTVRLLPALLILLLATSCEKEPRDPDPVPSHIRIESPEILPLPYNEPFGTAFQASIQIAVDSLPDGEELLRAGICWTPAPEVPHCSDTTLYIDFGISSITADETPLVFDYFIHCLFLTPGEKWTFRNYVRTNRDIYYSAPVTYAPEAIPTDDNVTELPVVFHLLTSDPESVSPRFVSYTLGRQVAHANLALRDALKHSQLTEPSEDIHLRLVPVTHTPSGERLAQPGLDIVRWNRLPIDPNLFLSTPTPEELALCWDPNRYLNVWIFPYGGVYTENTGMAIFPPVPLSHPLEGMASTDYYADPRNRDINPGFTLNAHYLYQGDEFTLGHELGHVLGLFHTFSAKGCGTGEDYCADTRDYDYSAFINSYNRSFFDLRTDCNDGTQFLSVNAMDYRGYSMSFTPDQNARMQHILQYGYFIPGSETARNAAAGRSKAPRDAVRPTPRTSADPIRKPSVLQTSTP